MSFWVDEIVSDIEKQLPQDNYLITDWKTPSGHAHFGSLRGPIIFDIIRRGLIETDKSATFLMGTSRIGVKLPAVKMAC